MIAPFQRLSRTLGRWWARLRDRLPARVSAWLDRWQHDGASSDASAPARPGRGPSPPGRPPSAAGPGPGSDTASGPSGTRAPAVTLEGRVRVSAGWISIAPLTVPSREYLLRLPEGYDPRRRWPLLVWVHGCRQSPEVFRDGTRISAHADAAGLVLLMPRQTRAANPMRCWNWFESATAHGEGEVALILAQMDQVSREHSIDSSRVAIAGVSSGAALAVALTVHAPTRIRALISMAGVAWGVTGPLHAAEVMREGPDHDATLPSADRSAAGGAPIAHPAPATAPRVDALIVQGDRDIVVAPVNAIALTRQMLALDGAPPPAHDGPAAARSLPPCGADRTESMGDRSVRIRDFEPRPDVLVRLMQIEGLGHAWPGGDSHFAYHEATGPDLSAIAVGFATAAFARNATVGAPASGITWSSVWRRRHRPDSRHAGKP